VTFQEHQEFVRDVIGKFKLRTTVLEPEDPQCVDLIVRCIGSSNYGRHLLGNVLSSWMMDVCSLRCDTRPIYNLALGLSQAIEAPRCRNLEQIVDLSRHVRSYLFWFFVNTGNTDKDLVIAGSRLDALCIQTMPECAASAELILSTGGVTYNWRPRIQPKKNGRMRD
jgi:hypothetical protein